MRWWPPYRSRPTPSTTSPAWSVTPAGPPGTTDDLCALLGRPSIDLDTPELQRYLAGRRVLVTGAGGSIGGEICRQTMKFCPERLILVERSEPALFEIDRELRQQWIGADLAPCLADVTDVARVERLFAEERPDVVFHAAAHKHVPLMESHPGEAVKNNVFGTQTVVEASVRHGVGSFVLISTDKAVHPSSVMGATKRVAEMIVQAAAVEGENGRTQRGDERRTIFSAVRFGNVLGSSGSVVPVFARQIDAGGPVTVTHPQMRRFFMTIPEASQLVMQAGALERPGEVFVLDMGEPVSILELAERMIRSRGLRPGDDVPIRFTGVRPGEKLQEELAGTADEPTVPTGHARIHVWRLGAIDPPALRTHLLDLREVTDAPPHVVVAALDAAVPEFRRGPDTLPPRLRLAA